MKARPYSFLFPLVLFFVLAMATNSLAGETAWLSAGFWAGRVERYKKEIKNYELNVSYRLPWSSRARGWEIDTALTAGLHSLKNRNDTKVGISVGPGFCLYHRGLRLALDAAGRIALLSGDSIGRLDMGGRFQFIAHAGLTLYPLWNIGLGYRFEHISNDSLYDSNPGIDFHMVGLSYRF